MQNADRLESLINAHRALAARHEALFQIAKVMFAIIPADPVMKQQLLSTVQEATCQHMQSAGQDAEYQQSVCQAMDELRDVLLLPHAQP